MTKFIVVQPYRVNPEEHWGYAVEMRVASSSHPRFTPGYRFDFGFHSIAVSEGYAVTYLEAVDGGSLDREIGPGRGALQGLMDVVESDESFDASEYLLNARRKA